MASGAMGTQKPQRKRKNEAAEGSAAKKAEVAVAAAAPAGFTFTMDGHDVLDCAICSHPLRPPVFQCTVGHNICSSCHDKIPGKCCCHSTVYNRFYALDRVVESIKVACSNGNHGCTARIPYCQKEDHEKSCPHAPCFCPDPGCGFSGTTSTVALVDHFCGQHKWLYFNFKFNDMIETNIEPGSTILMGEDGNLFLVNMELKSHGTIIISVCCIQPHDTGSKFKCRLGMMFFAEQCMYKEFYTRSTNLYNGLPNDCDAFYVPNNLLQGDGATTRLVVTLIKQE